MKRGKIFRAGLVALLVAGCSPADPHDPQGPVPIWTVTLATGTGQEDMARIGEILVIPERRALLAVKWNNGTQVWRRELAEDYSMTVAGEHLVVTETKDGPQEVVDPATGTTTWKADKGGVVYRDAIYVFGCTGIDGGRPKGCTITARDIRDGSTLWTVPSGGWGVSDDAVGVRRPYAPAAGRWLAAGTDPNRWDYAATDPATGRPQSPGVRLDGWYQFAAESVLVTTDHDAPDSNRCTVAVTAYDAATGTKAWAGEVFSAHRPDGSCFKRLVPTGSGMIFIGTGSRIAAVSEGGRPQVVDLATGKSVWTADTVATPIDGSATAILTRRGLESGPLTVLDFTTGRTLWTAPDPGLPESSASWKTTVTKYFAAVTGAVDDHPVVHVYGLTGGERMGDFPGWMGGAGDDWVTIVHGDNGQTNVVDFFRL